MNAKRLIKSEQNFNANQKKKKIQVVRVTGYEKVIKKTVSHLHDNRRDINVGLDCLVRKDATTVYIDLICNCDIVS